MKYTPPNLGDRRVRKGFLFRKKTIGGITKHFTFTHWEEFYDAPWFKWMPLNWLEKRKTGYLYRPGCGSPTYYTDGRPTHDKQVNGNLLTPEEMAIATCVHTSTVGAERFVCTKCGWEMDK